MWVDCEWKKDHICVKEVFDDRLSSDSVVCGVVMDNFVTSHELALFTRLEMLIGNGRQFFFYICRQSDMRSFDAVSNCYVCTNCCVWAVRAWVVRSWLRVGVKREVEWLSR